MKTDKSLITRLKEAYEKGKKPIAYIIIVAIFALEILANLSVFPSEVTQKIEMTLLVTVVMILLEILFQVYEKVVADKSLLKVIKPNQLYDELLNLVQTSKRVDIKYIGVAGRFGWYSVLSRLLDKSNNDSLHDATKFNVEIALVSPEFYENNKNYLDKFDALFPVTQDIIRVQENLQKLYSDDDSKQLTLYSYDYLPNFVGFLINDNYLFLNACYWEETENTELTFRAGGTEYLVYDKNDEFGGSHYIDRFNGWFNYIKR
jgi:hypothetical protein